MISRRLFLGGASLAALSACTNMSPQVTRSATPASAAPPAPVTPMPDFYGPVSDGGFDIPAVPDGSIPEHYWRQKVSNPYPDRPIGSIVIDPNQGLLWYIEDADTCTRYGVGVGAEGRAWSGDAFVWYTAKWPRWRVPESIYSRFPEYKQYAWYTGGMPPGLDNPLGARAMYIYQDGKDTGYRIHGGCEPKYIGHSVSSGCIRMLNQDAIDVYNKVTGKGHVPVKVLPTFLDQPQATLY